MTRVATFLFAATLVAGLVAACGSDKPKGAEGSTSSSAGGAASSSGSSSSGGASSSGDASIVFTDGGGVGCDLVKQLAEEVAELGVPENRPPGNGGALKPGIYFLSEIDEYKGPQPPPPGQEAAPTVPTGNAARITLIVSTKELRFLESKGSKGALPPDTMRAFSYTANGTSPLDVKPVCPTQTGPTTIEYTALGERLAIFRDATHREIYVRNP